MLQRVFFSLKCGVQWAERRSNIKAYLRLLSNLSVDLSVLEITNCSLTCTVCLFVFGARSRLFYRFLEAVTLVLLSVSYTYLQTIIGG